ncbi:glutathione-dependent disulfide-bond oxidoreductase [Rhodobacteraceae bacterium]|nr:glutathione-dependent disulfide-bond oxidoreductase [Paracoccaceae bacterium]
MSETYTPPAVWTPPDTTGGRFGAINQPTAGPRFDRALPVGDHDLQLYSLGTPNGQKVSILLEELLEAGHTGAEYDAWLINIMDLDQFSSGFVEVNPNSKIPAMVDRSGEAPVRLFESGSIMLYLAEKFGAFLPASGAARAEVINWLMWQMGSAPFLGGGFGHFYAYAPEKLEYPINRYAMEAKRQMDVLDRQLADHRFIAGADYTIADIAIYPWYGALVEGRAYGDAATFLQADQYTHLKRWADEVGARTAVLRGRRVNQSDPEKGVAERHSPADLD